MENVGRNDPCPCGSGKKYKQCCWEERVCAMRDEDAFEAHAMLLELLDEPDVAATCRLQARTALAEWAVRFDALMLQDLQSLRAVQDALFVHIAVDELGGPSLSAAWAVDLPRNARAGLRKAFEHFAKQRLVIYRAADERVDGALELTPIEPADAEPTVVRLSDSIDIEPGALVFGRSLYEPLALRRHLLPFPRRADTTALVAHALAQSESSSRFRVLFAGWIAAWAPRIEREGLVRCFGRTRRHVKYSYKNREALAEALGGLPDAVPIDFGQFDEEKGEMAESGHVDYYALRVPDAERGDFDANFVIDELHAFAEIDSADDEPALRAFVEPHVGSNLSYLVSIDERDLDQEEVRIEFVTPSETRAPGVVRVRAELAEISPPIWREFDVPLAATLADLHDALIEAFGWDDAHLHAFETSIGRFMARSDENGDNVGDEFAIPVAQALTAVDEKLTWEYDFGDGWVTTVTAVAIDAAAPPRFTLHAGARACPPEDCGGPYGYAEIVEAMQNKRHPRRRELIDWLGEPFDPEAFELAEHARFVDELN
jgi:hypothetical protein